jgi:ribosomal protein S27AE
MDRKRIEALEAAEEMLMELYRSDCPRFDRTSPCVKCNLLMRAIQYINDEREAAFGDTTPTATCPQCGWYLSANERERLIYCDRCDYSKTVPLGTGIESAPVAP